MQYKNITSNCTVQENELRANRMSHDNMNTIAAKESTAFYFTILCKTSLQYDEKPHKIKPSIPTPAQLMPTQSSLNKT